MTASFAKAGIAAAFAASLALAAPPAPAAAFPGSGQTLRFAQSDSHGAHNVQDQILIAGIEKLGYKVSLTTVGIAAFFQAAAQGDLDMTGDINWPQREPPYRAVEKQLALVGDGSISGGGINPNPIDKKTADAHHITRFAHLKHPKIAALFDTDGDGRADLINCDPGWSCGDVVDYQIKAFGLDKTVHSVRGKYEALMAQTFAKFKRGEPVLYYTWSPSWVVDTLVPGRDVVWLPTPFGALPKGVSAGSGSLVKDVVGCAGGQNPCRMTTGSWNWRTVARRDFLEQNPSVKKLGELARWPLATWSAWEGAISKGANNNREIKKLAQAWIAANQKTFDGWVQEAAAAK
jgi:glycine betaine/proline transport system substrate-binding protein